MKIRTNFVSNSSSSSFVVGFPKGEKDTVVTFEVSTDLKHYIHERIQSRKRLDEYLKDRWYGDEGPQWYKNALEVLEAGGYILVGSFTNEDEAIERWLCDEGLSSDMNSKMIILESEGGF